MELLIVEDNPASRILMQTMLTREGYAPVFLADNGVDAWELLQEKPVRMVITDWMMPRMDGLELCRKIRGGSFKNYIYIILLTAKIHSSDVVMGLNAGANDFISKPVNREELLARLRAGHRVIHLEDDQQKANFQLLQTEKMASIGQLAAGVAHEINNPIGFVSSNIKVLKEYNNTALQLYQLYQSLMIELEKNEMQIPGGINEIYSRIRRFEKENDIAYLTGDTVELIEDCREGVDRIKKIVCDLKDFAHPGKDELKTVDINASLESTLNVISNEVKYKAAVHKEFGSLPPVRCYPQRLNQVFLNLIVNAAQSIEPMGDITIRTRQEGMSIEIDIEDNGCGISPENLQKIFDPFFTTKEVGKGTGLGLHVAYQIIQKHKGRIDVESEPGKGTRFRITIPVNEEALHDEP